MAYNTQINFHASLIKTNSKIKTIDNYLPQQDSKKLQLQIFTLDMQ